MGITFHPEVDNFYTYCQSCRKKFHISFSGSPEEIEHKIEAPCECPKGPSPESITIAKKIIVFQAEHDPSGRAKEIEERGIK